jgi:hypothetical protein
MGESAPVKYWEIIARNLSAAGWTWGYSSALTPAGVLHIVDLRDGENRRFVVRSDEKLTAFMEAERIIKHEYHSSL